MIIDLQLLGSEVDPQVVRKLDIGQRRAIVCRMLEKKISSSRMKVDNSLGLSSFTTALFSDKVDLHLTACIEMLLHLIWRHITYYASNHASTSSFDRQRPFNA